MTSPSQSNVRLVGAVPVARKDVAFGGFVNGEVAAAHGERNDVVFADIVKRASFSIQVTTAQSHFHDLDGPVTQRRDR